MLLYLSPKAKKDEKRLLKALKGVCPDDQRFVCRDLEQVRRAFMTGADKLEDGLILAGDRNDLEDLLEFRELLRKLNLIVLLPDEDPQTLALAHKLGPRYSAQLDDDFETAGLVLTMFRRRVKQPASEGAGNNQRKDASNRGGLKPAGNRPESIHKR